MGRTVDPARHAARRGQIRDRAAGLFAEQGYDRTTTAQICRAAGISPGNLYHYFPSKKQIFIAVLTDDAPDTAALLDRLLGSAAPLEAVLAFVDHLAAPAAAHPAVPRLVLEAMLQAHRDPEINDALSRTDADEQAGLARLLRRAVAAGEVDRGLDPDDAAAWLSALVAAVYLGTALSPDGGPGPEPANLRRTARAYLTAE